MPQFAPDEVKTARAPVTVEPSGLSCQVELALMSNSVKAAMSVVPFTSTGVEQPVSLPITMPGVEGTYPVHIDILAEDLLVGAYKATEDVVIQAPVPANLLLNPGFEAGFDHWINYCNYPGRFHWTPSYEIGPRTGRYSAAASGSVSGRSIVATMTQTVPWNDLYRGKTFKFSVWRRMVAGTKHEGYFRVSMGGAVNEVYAYYSADFVEQSVTATLPLNATSLSVQFQIKPHRDWRSGGLSVDDTDLRIVG